MSTMASPLAGEGKCVEAVQLGVGLHAEVVDAI